MPIAKSTSLAPAPRPPGPSRRQAPFTITVVFLGGPTTQQKNAFKSAADRWSKVIVGNLPNVVIAGQVIDDVLIEASGVAIDGPGGILGQAGPTHLRPATAGASKSFRQGPDAVRHGRPCVHAGQRDPQRRDHPRDGSCARRRHHLEPEGVLAGANTNNPTFTGKSAKRAYGQLKGTGPTPVPVENQGGPGTANSHWRDAVFRNELMTGFVAGPPNPLSRLTAASLKDLGYKVALYKAEPYSLPNLLKLAEGKLIARASQGPEGMVLPTVPMTLPPESLA